METLTKSAETDTEERDSIDVILAELIIEIVQKDRSLDEWQINKPFWGG